MILQAFISVQPSCLAIMQTYETKARLEGYPDSLLLNKNQCIYCFELTCSGQIDKDNGNSDKRYMLSYNCGERRMLDSVRINGFSSGYGWTSEKVPLLNGWSYSIQPQPYPKPLHSDTAWLFKATCQNNEHTLPMMCDDSKIIDFSHGPRSVFFPILAKTFMGLHSQLTNLRIGLLDWHAKKKGETLCQCQNPNTSAGYNIQSWYCRWVPRNYAKQQCMGMGILMK